MVLERTAIDGMVWVCWPKKASGVPTDLDEDFVRELGLATGVVDVKVVRGRRDLVRPEVRAAAPGPVTQAVCRSSGERPDVRRHQRSASTARTAATAKM